MRIAIVTIGTRGDVQPYLAVGAALKARGHDVVIATHDEFEPMIRARGFEHRPIVGGVREILQTELGKKWLSSADSPREYSKYVNQIFQPLQAGFHRDIDAALEGCDGVLFYAMAMHAIDAAERRKLPIACLAPWPAAATAHIVPFGLPVLGAFPGFLIRWSWSALLRMMFAPSNEAFQAHRAEVGLPRYPEPSPYHRIATRKIPVVHLFSEHVIARPDDWDAHLHIAGFPFVPPSDYTPPRALSRFLEGDRLEGRECRRATCTPTDPPIYIGFGSMTGHSAEELATLSRAAARRVGVRAVYATGWSDCKPESDDDFHVIEEAPHDWLFPRVRAVVHHGGAGTFAAGLRAGRPTVINAFFGDQPAWGQANERLGTGPKTLRRRGLTEEKLADAIREAITNPTYRERATAIAARMAAEDGAARAAEIAERVLLA